MNPSSPARPLPACRQPRHHGGRQQTLRLSSRSPQPLEWRFGQVFGERAAGEEVQEGTVLAPSLAQSGLPKSLHSCQSARSLGVGFCRYQALRAAFQKVKEGTDVAESRG